MILGLTGALVYGAADFFGGIAAKRISALKVTAIGAASGLVLLLLLLPVTGGTWSVEAVTLGALSGISGALAISLLYACLAIGPMSILSPLTAVISAMVPLTAGVLRGDRLPPLGYLALGLALIAVVLVGFVPDRKAVRPSAKALAMAVGAGSLIGVFLIVIDLTPSDSGVVPLIANRTVNATLMFTTIGVLAALASRRARRSDAAVRADAAGSTTASTSASSGPASSPASTPGRLARWSPGLRLAVVGGTLDATANVLILLGLRAGDLSIMAVLTAMYPAGTIILAAVLLKERITPTQGIGLVLALTAAAMLALI
ncbi:EamA family transporter [Marisediminicola antarctica]|uniref:EamA family transporter n=1 Tax=Marisediminicola antarctica TaxID=674079 RepID=UPI001EFFCDC1|nr:EamA family transporter [Marisediminicola antarctica]